MKFKCKFLIQPSSQVFDLIRNPFSAVSCSWNLSIKHFSASVIKRVKFHPNSVPIVYSVSELIWLFQGRHQYQSIITEFTQVLYLCTILNTLLQYIHYLLLNTFTPLLLLDNFSYLLPYKIWLFRADLLLLVTSDSVVDTETTDWWPLSILNHQSDRQLIDTDNNGPNNQPDQ